ncbi:DUF433 domain-containing protein [Lusitaniella coriacea LEGE 07157]|uniref:DUF433 domain-containing protein n=1 Tax=Lusitaniella coriacea LEGE 07157 TaxID=945747 RepID=A0A8J7B8L9_9CYAN|nr:DUF433 domain-containing protein [Lusitaniella coriacea]MBE9114718.1 DUF433 domain-containing protein [Lusitaniella coriacea LEGE 07157]
MQLEDYFDIQRPDDIRLKGTRVGIETVLYDFLQKSCSPEEIAQTYPSITLEQVYATILYYLQSREEIDNYMINWLTHGYKMRAEQRLNQPSIKLEFRSHVHARSPS